MTRERIPPGTVLQRAYGVLDKYQMSRTFFIKTDQKGCDPEPPAFEAYDPTEPTSGATSVKDAPVKKRKKPLTAEKSIVDTATNEQLPSAAIVIMEKQEIKQENNATDSV